ncbi:mannose-1-phosphate guanylyltransferase [bacterium]|nr:mannose-1-phosphate guanylyltransferase [bacterium]
MITSILAGGIGSRFWPLSTPKHPKQFLSLYDEDSLFSLTLKRIAQLDNNIETLVITRDEYLPFISKYLDLKPLIEPIGRNTFGAVLLTTKYLYDQGLGDEPILFLPSDHMIKDIRNFKEDIKNGVDLVINKKIMVTFGITPTYPETGYGYILTSRVIDDSISLFGVKGFKEKPDLPLAQYFLMSKKYFWNCGISITTANIFFNELKMIYPKLYEKTVTLSMEEWLKDFHQIPNEHCERVIVEHARNIAMIKASFDWSDVGTWRAYFDIFYSKLGNQNHILQKNSHDNFILSNKKTIVIGLNNITVVDSEEGLLIMSNEKDQELKEAFSMLEENNK